MLVRPVSKFLYVPAIALAISLVAGGYVYNRTLDNWMTDIVSSYMLGLLNDVNHEVEEDKLHFYDLTIDEIDDFLDNLSQSSGQQRFTIIHDDGTVLGDSQMTKQEILHADNHSQRPEVISALESGQGIARRYSTTSNQDVLYVAVRMEIEDEDHDLLNTGETGNHAPHNDERQHDETEHNHEKEMPGTDGNKHSKRASEHQPHSSVYVLRVAMPMTSLYRMSEDLRLILYLLMAASMAVLLGSSWYSNRRIAQVISAERELLEVRINKSTREIELLRQLANMLAACKNIREAQLVVEDIVPRILGDINGCISIMRESRNFLEIELDWGGSWPAARSFAPHDCWAMRKGKFHLSQEQNHSLTCNHMSDAGADNTTMCIPLTAHGNTVGIFHLYFGDKSTPVPEETRQLAFTLSEHLGLALANLSLQEKLRSQAMRDPLTGLYNRRYFEDKLESEWSIAHQNEGTMSLLMLDLDHFKLFNDNFGHDAGDYVLKELGNLLNNAISKKCPVSRLGGEEFAIICSDTDEEESMKLARQIIEEVRELHLDIKGLSLGQLGISVGVATYPDTEVSAEDLVKLADTALYQAKERGRGMAVHANQMGDFHHSDGENI